MHEHGLYPGTAAFSPCGLFRYGLHRCWGDGARLTWLMLNPSTATATTNDPTMVRVIDFSRRLGFDGCVVGNLFAFRATDPADLRRAGYPVGPANDDWIQAMLESVVESGSDVVVAYGAHARGLSRVDHVLGMMRRAGVRPMCLGTTHHGLPRHPLFVHRSQRLQTYGDHHADRIHR